MGAYTGNGEKRGPRVSNAVEWAVQCGLVEGAGPGSDRLVLAIPLAFDQLVIPPTQSDQIASSSRITLIW